MAEKAERAEREADRRERGTANGRAARQKRGSCLQAARRKATQCSGRRAGQNANATQKSQPRASAIRTLSPRMLRTLVYGGHTPEGGVPHEAKACKAGRARRQAAMAAPRRMHANSTQASRACKKAEKGKRKEKGSNRKRERERKKEGKREREKEKESEREKE